MVNLLKLTNEQIVSVYHEHMIEDFPPDELKALEKIQSAMKIGRYVCYGLYSNAELVGYVFLERINNDYLVDYIATFPQKRNGGLGAELLALLTDALKDSDSVIGEVEDPAFAETEEARSLQNRRLAFYLRNGIIDTGVKVTTFGVHYRVLELPTGHLHSPEEIRALYKKQYQVFFSEEECTQFIHM